jgi:hypothetical protein
MTVRWASAVTLIAGAWMIFAPFLIGAGDVASAAWNGVLVGLAILGVAYYRMMRPARSNAWSWLNATLGAWLIAAPFVLGVASDDAAAWNGVIIGLVVLIAASISASAGRRLQLRMSH